MHSQGKTRTLNQPLRLATTMWESHHASTSPSNQKGIVSLLFFDPASIGFSVNGRIVFNKLFDNFS